MHVDILEGVQGDKTPDVMIGWQRHGVQASDFHFGWASVVGVRGGVFHRGMTHIRLVVKWDSPGRPIKVS